MGGDSLLVCVNRLPTVVARAENELFSVVGAPPTLRNSAQKRDAPGRSLAIVSKTDARRPLGMKAIEPLKAARPIGMRLTSAKERGGGTMNDRTV